MGKRDEEDREERYVRTDIGEWLNDIGAYIIGAAVILKLDILGLIAGSLPKGGLSSWITIALFIGISIVTGYFLAKVLRTIVNLIRYPVETTTAFWHKIFRADESDRWFLRFCRFLFAFLFIFVSIVVFVTFIERLSNGARGDEAAIFGILLLAYFFYRMAVAQYDRYG